MSKIELNVELVEQQKNVSSREESNFLSKLSNTTILWFYTPNTSHAEQTNLDDLAEKQSKKMGEKIKYIGWRLKRRKSFFRFDCKFFPSSIVW